MRLLVITPYYKPAFCYGGPARSIPALCENLATQGVSVTVYTTDANGSERLNVANDKPIDVDGPRVWYHRLSDWPPRRYFFAPGLGRACRRLENFDIAYVCGNWTYPPLVGARGAERAGIPYVCSPRGSFMIRSMRSGRLKKLVYLRLFEKSWMDGAKALHCTSPMEASEIEKWGFRAPVETIANGLDLAPFRALPPRGRMRLELGIPENAPVTLFVGRLQRAKRLDCTLRTFATVAAGLPSAHLLVAGPDEDGTGRAAETLSCDLGLRDRIHFTGLLTRDRVLQAFADSDLLVLLSRRENFGMAAVEGMAAGLPVLLSPEVGVAEQARRNGAALVEPVDSAGLATAWKSLLDSPGRRQALGEAGRRHTEECYSAEMIARKMLLLFERVAHRP